MKPGLQWRPQNVVDAGSVGCLSSEAVGMEWSQSKGEVESAAGIRAGGI